MTSPLIKHNFLLSSRTVFIFSIQTASMGPSNMTHFLSGVSVIANSRKVLAVTPSDHYNIIDHKLLIHGCPARDLANHNGLKNTLHESKSMPNGCNHTVLS